MWNSNNSDSDNTAAIFDKLCDLAVTNYNLDDKNREMNFLDLITFFCLWWKENKNSMGKYKTQESIAILLKRDRTSIIHHLNAFEKDKYGRKVSNNYEKNIVCIKDFLES